VDAAEIGTQSQLLALPPAIGPAPRPPQLLRSALRRLDAPVERRQHELAANPAAQAGDPLQGAVGAVRSTLATVQRFEALLGGDPGRGFAASFASEMRAMFGPDAPGFARARVRGLTPDELAAWCAVARTDLDETGRRALLDYALHCRAWEQVLDGTIGSGSADPDWDMTGARRVRPSAPEARLALALERAGLPVQAQVGVSRMGGRRRGGWYRAFWLDCAYRDIGFLLRMDLELDGAAHRTPRRRQRDALRNELLRVRGWYILRFDVRLLRADADLQRAVRTASAIAQRHRRAVVLGRTDPLALAAGLELDEAAHVVQVWEQTWRPQVKTALRHYQVQLEQLASLELL
jgi:hypothetical protein